MRVKNGDRNAESDTSAVQLKCRIEKVCVRQMFVHSINGKIIEQSRKREEKLSNTSVASQCFSMIKIVNSWRLWYLEVAQNICNLQMYLGISLLNLMFAKIMIAGCGKRFIHTQRAVT